MILLDPKSIASDLKVGYRNGKLSRCGISINSYRTDMQVLQLWLLLSVNTSCHGRFRTKLVANSTSTSLDKTPNDKQYSKAPPQPPIQQSACLEVANVLIGGQGSNDDDNGGQRNKTRTHPHTSKKVGTFQLNYDVAVRCTARGGGRQAKYEHATRINFPKSALSLQCWRLLVETFSKANRIP